MDAVTSEREGPDARALRCWRRLLASVTSEAASVRRELRVEVSVVSSSGVVTVVDVGEDDDEEEEAVDGSVWVS